jgi:hypothetical protein
MHLFFYYVYYFDINLAIFSELLKILRLGIFEEIRFQHFLIKSSAGFMSA